MPKEFEADNGPYRSMTSTIGNVDLETGAVTIYASPKTKSYQDGFKGESVVRVQHISPYLGHDFATQTPATFISTDEENYGGTLRKVKLFRGSNDVGDVNQLLSSEGTPRSRQGFGHGHDHDYQHSVTIEVSTDIVVFFLVATIALTVGVCIACVYERYCRSVKIYAAVNSISDIEKE